MLKLKIDIRVTGEDWRTIAEASATVDIAQGSVNGLGYCCSDIARILGDSLAAEIRKALSLPAQPEDDDDGE